MKLYLTLILALAATQGLSAEEGIKADFTIQQKDQFLTQPSVTFKANKEIQVNVTQEFSQPGNLSLPVGMLIKGQSKLKAGKIIYSFVLTIRELQDTQSHDGQNASSFKTREFLLSGDTSSGQELKFVLADEITLFMTFSLVPIEK